MHDIEFKQNEIDTAKLKVLVGSRGVALFVEQDVKYPTETQVLFANKVLDHVEAKELRDFLIKNYPLENENA